MATARNTKSKVSSASSCTSKRSAYTVPFHPATLSNLPIDVNGHARVFDKDSWLAPRAEFRFKMQLFSLLDYHHDRLIKEDRQAYEKLSAKLTQERRTSMAGEKMLDVACAFITSE